VSAAVPPPFSRARRLYPRLAPSPPRLAPPPASTRSSPHVVILDRAVAVTGAPHFAFARPCPQRGPPHQRERRGGGRRALPRRRIQIHERWAATAVAIVASVATAPANLRRRASEAELSDLASATRGARGLLGCVAEEGVEGAGHGKVPGQLQLADGSDDGRVRPLLVAVASPRTPAPATELIPSASMDHAGVKTANLCIEQPCNLNLIQHKLFQGLPEPKLQVLKFDRNLLKSAILDEHDSNGEVLLFLLWVQAAVPN